MGEHWWYVLCILLLTHCAPRMKKKKKSTQGKYIACEHAAHNGNYIHSLLVHEGELKGGGRVGGRWEVGEYLHLNTKPELHDSILVDLAPHVEDREDES